jgi:phage regulator Rha-like protein
MSSREIAELLECRHDSVKRTIERLAERGVVTLPPLVETSFIGVDGRLQRSTEYRIGKRDSYVIVAQLSPEFTARLVDRWQELEEAHRNGGFNLPDFTNPAEAARAWALAYEQAQQATGFPALQENLSSAEVSAQRGDGASPPTEEALGFWLAGLEGQFGEAGFVDALREGVAAFSVTLKKQK